MRNFRICILSLCVLLPLSSCDFLENNKELVGAIADVVESELNKDSASDEHGGSSAGTITGTDDLLMQSSPDGMEEQILRREGYITSYNRKNRLPNWVAWHLTESRSKGPANRSDVDFKADDDVPAPRAEDSDYYGSGYDRGHICPAADNKWSTEAMSQSFLFTNICPQDGGLNRGDWNEMEQACRQWASTYGGIYIVSGPILYKGKHKTIGRNKVVVPEAFFKVVLRTGSNPAAIGFIYKNTDGNRPKGDYVNTVDEVERITGIDFFPALPDDVEAAVEARCSLDEWM